MPDNKMHSVLSNRLYRILAPLSFFIAAALATTTPDDQSSNIMASSSTSENGQCPNNNSDCGVAVDVGLSEVPETALWTLHNRASSASDPAKDWFRDDKAIEIYSSIDYDYEASFGTPNESSGIRGWVFDQQILEFWKAHPDGCTVVNFAEGLETQRFRLEKSRPSSGATWITVDLLPAIQARERFILPDEDKNLHVAASVLETHEWIKFVPKDKPVFFLAQGLFMYLQEDDVRGFLQTMAKEFPSATIVFDLISKWLSDKAMSPEGWKLTEKYKTPKMPFGINKNKAIGVLQNMVPDAIVEEIPWPFEKNTGFFIQYIVPILVRIPIVQNAQPGMVIKMKFPPSTKEEQ